MVMIGMAVTLTPLIIGTLFAHPRFAHEFGDHLWRARGAMTVDAAITGACEVAESQTPVLGVAVPYAMANVFFNHAGPNCRGHNIRWLELQLQT